MLISIPQFFFRIIPGDILQTENPDREILPTEFFPVRYLFIENIFYLSRTQLIDLILLIQSENISFFYHFTAKQPECFGKQEQYDKQDRNTCNKTATSQYSFHYLFKNLLHTC